MSDEEEEEEESAFRAADGPFSTEDQNNSTLVTNEDLSVIKSKNSSHGSSNKSLEGHLDVSSPGLFGRDRELSVLKQSLNEVSSGAVKRHLILVSGFSGTGKTSLVYALEEPVRAVNGIFVRGKFDRYLRNVGVPNACAEICGHVVSLQLDNPTRFQHVRQLIKTELSSELSLLIQYVPALGELIDVDHNEQQDRWSSAGSSDEARNRFQFAFKRFLRIICSELGPLCLVLDDLQWGDKESLEIIHSLVSDQGNVGLFLVGIYRSNEAEEVFLQELASWKARHKEDSSAFELTELAIRDLSLEAVTNIIQNLLGMEQIPTMMDLAKVVHRKTNGNALFVLCFLSMLSETRLLRRSTESQAWQWDVDEIEMKARASENVVDLLKAKMNDLPFSLRKILKIAACLGSTFEAAPLTLCFEAFCEEDFEQGPGCSDLYISRGLSVLEQTGFIKGTEKVSCLPERTYYWTHDKIREAALSMIPVDELAPFKRRIGQTLLSHLNEDNLGSAVFAVTNLMNEGKDALKEDQQLRVARLNHQASQRALSVSAFDSAAKYAQIGIDMLPENRWDDDHYKLTLSLYSIGAHTLGYLGNVELMESYCNKVLEQTTRPTKDKLDVYNSWIDSMINRGKIAEAGQLILDVLGLFSCRFPRNSVLIGLGVLGNLARVKVTLRTRNMAKLPEMKDETRIELMNLIGKLCTCLYMEKDGRFPLSVFRCLNWTMKYGYCEYSSVAVATTGLMLTGVLGDLMGGSRYGEQALQLLEKGQCNRLRAKTFFMVYTFLYPWTIKLSQCLPPLMQGYNAGLQYGDVEHASWAMVNWLLIKFVAGTPLVSLEDDFFFYLKQMKELKRQQQLYIVKFVRQIILNFMGRSGSDFFKTTGEACSKEDICHCENDTFLSTSMVNWGSWLLTFGGDHIRHADQTLRLGHDYLEKGHISSPYIQFDTCLKGVSCYVAASMTKERAYADAADKMRSKIQKWLKMGNPNVGHFASLLDAEAARYRGRNSEAMAQYQCCVTNSYANGYLHFAAFASERLAEFQVRIVGDRGGAAFQEAIRYYKEWGAEAKADEMERRFAHIFSQPKEIFTISEASGSVY